MLRLAEILRTLNFWNTALLPFQVPHFGFFIEIQSKVKIDSSDSKWIFCQDSWFWVFFWNSWSMISITPLSGFFQVHLKVFDLRKYLSVRPFLYIQILHHSNQFQTIVMLLQVWNGYVTRFKGTKGKFEHICFEPIQCGELCKVGHFHVSNFKRTIQDCYKQW